MADSYITGNYDGLNMPYSPEAEQAVLGAIILDSTVFEQSGRLHKISRLLLCGIAQGNF